jgi:histidinol-phosphate phosphatase family protein
VPAIHAVGHFVQVRVHSQESLMAFMEEARKLSEVQECYHMTGAFDFLLSLAIKDMDEYNDVLIKKLSKLPDVGNMQSSSVMSEVKKELGICSGRNEERTFIGNRRMNKAVFLDLNGTLVLPLRQESLSELALIPGADLPVAKLLAGGFICPVVTIQSGIGKCRFTEQEFRDWFVVFFRECKLDLKGPYICPHRFASACICKKPNPFLYEQAAKDHHIDLSSSYVIGDTAWDAMAGKNLGSRGCLVRTDGAIGETEYQKAKAYAAYIGQTLGEVVQWILEESI